MSKRIAQWASILILLAAAACLSPSGGAPPPASPTPTALVEPLLPLSTGEAILTATPSPTNTPVLSEIEGPTPSSTPTETPLPTQELPTPAPQGPERLYWTGDPTYPADSELGLVWRLTYDTATWALTTDDLSGLPMLGHRSLPYCAMVPSEGHGLPPDYHVENDFRTFGLLFYGVATVFQGDAPQFVTYTGGDRRILTAFQVNFQQEMETCLADAETVLATLTTLSATPSPALLLISPLSGPPAPCSPRSRVNPQAE
jgi:hypothetical protein